MFVSVTKLLPNLISELLSKTLTSRNKNKNILQNELPSTSNDNIEKPDKVPSTSLAHDTEKTDNAKVLEDLLNVMNQTFDGKEEFLKIVLDIITQHEL